MEHGACCTKEFGFFSIDISDLFRVCSRKMIWLDLWFRKISAAMYGID